MAIVTVTRNAQVTIPKKIREALGIKEGDRITMRVEDGKVVLEKVTEDVWSNCTDFLPENFEKVLEKLRKDSRERLKRLGLTP
jgi:AbrB family looped-hinge helix DNA binding protein